MVAPFVFMILLAGIEFVRVNVVRHTIENAAYNASRAVIVPGATKAEALDVAQQTLAIANIVNAEITFDPEVITEDTVFVKTNIRVPMEENSWGAAILFKGQFLSAETVLRTERSPLVQARNLPTVLNPEPEPEPPPEPPEPEPEPEIDKPEIDEPEIDEPEIETRNRRTRNRRTRNRRTRNRRAGNRRTGNRRAGARTPTASASPTGASVMERSVLGSRKRRI